MQWNDSKYIELELELEHVPAVTIKRAMTTTSGTGHCMYAKNKYKLFHLLAVVLGCDLTSLSPPNQLNLLRGPRCSENSPQSVADALQHFLFRTKGFK